MMAQIVDFRNNQITKFDDSVLALYSVCNINSFAYFLRLLQKMRIDSNPLDCSCSSYNMLSFYQTYITIPNNPQISNNIFLPRCATPSIYFGRSIYSFTSISTCSSSLSFNNVCPTTTTTITTVTTALTTTTTLTTTQPNVGRRNIIKEIMKKFFSLFKRLLYQAN
jgi:hypothetical protein